MSADERTEAGREQRSAAATAEGNTGARKPYEPPRLEPRGKVERTTLVSGNCSVAPGPGC
jgi:hypothetical protein